MTPRLAATLKHLPDKPGVYLLKDASGRVLYVGKAQSLRNRVRQYWQAGRSAAPLRIESAIDQVVDVETTLTDTVSEALLLEANLIKRYQPRFNVRLKDDKSYPFIKVTLADDFPRIERTRKLPDDGSRYFGPYASASSVDESMNLIRRIFPFRTCTIEIREGERALDRPCLLYHIKRCQGPCIEAIERSAYRRDIEQVMLFLEGHQEQVSRALRTDMEAASEALQFERAAALRDKVRAIERTMESQKMAGFAKRVLDVLGYARSGNEAAVQLFAIRDGKTTNRDIFLLENLVDASDEEALTAFVKQYYARAGSIPPRVLVPFELAEAAELEVFLASRAGRKVELLRPQRGEGRQLMALAARNAAEMLAREQVRWLADQGKTERALAELAEALALAAPPQRIECYDISTIQGTSTVGSMVVFEDGQPRTGEYRRFRIRRWPARTTSPATRRCCGAASGARWTARRAPPSSCAGACPTSSSSTAARARSARPARCSTSSACTTCPWPAWPRSARSCSCPAQAEPIVLPATSGALYLLQRLRDEAHRFAITYHRQVRARAATRSALDDLAGVGPARKRALLRVFGSSRGLKPATVDEIAAVPGIGRATAERIRAHLDG